MRKQTFDQTGVYQNHKKLIRNQKLSSEIRNFDEKSDILMRKSEILIRKL
jgi:hypothetical protein